jgi:hypothetical protein
MVTDGGGDDKSDVLVAENEAMKTSRATQIF